MKKMENSRTLRITLLSSLTALVAVFTILVRVPTPTGGYINLCDVAIIFSASAFGPVSGLIAGGLGTAIADALGGYMQYAPISFVAHGVEGLVVGLILGTGINGYLKRILAALAAVIIVPLGYFLLAGAFLLGFATAAVEIPANALQALVGAVFGLIVSEAVRRSYRKLDELRF